ncbi:hypothetical protein TNCT_230711 [Trichonephila clavata]|uniref:Uncharacterized protein n=1 Tax=Trichonephila clavata TaxID=2740835 RepID=A0A8X6I2B1_TRICU|nr:hypothetical protein TNCT_230711 [Trichonephila clavata]
MHLQPEPSQNRERSPQHLPKTIPCFLVYRLPLFTNKLKRISSSELSVTPVKSHLFNVSSSPIAHFQVEAKLPSLMTSLQLSANQWASSGKRCVRFSRFRRIVSPTRCNCER